MLLAWPACCETPPREEAAPIGWPRARRSWRLSGLSSELMKTAHPTTGQVVAGARPHPPSAGTLRRRSGMRAHLRKAVLVAAALLPQPVKQLVYRWGFGYRVGRGVRIGVAYLDCAGLTLEDGARISHGVVFLQCGDVHIGK